MRHGWLEARSKDNVTQHSDTQRGPDQEELCCRAVGRGEHDRTVTTPREADGDALALGASWRDVEEGRGDVEVQLVPKVVILPQASQEHWAGRPTSVAAPLSQRVCRVDSTCARHERKDIEE